MVERITLIPSEAAKRNRRGWVLRLVKPVKRPSKEPREYEVIGKHPKGAR